MAGRPRQTAARTVYVDTGAFIALIWSRDRDHDAVREQYGLFRAERARLTTSDAVIGETATRLRYDAGLAAARTFHEVIRDATAAAALTIRESDGELRARAFAVMARYDGLTLSYADCVGAAVAADIRADAVFGLDGDFRVMGFHLEPSTYR